MPESEMRAAFYATVSLTTGIIGIFLFFFPVPSMLAVFYGWRARHIKRARIGRLLGFIGIGMLAILIFSFIAGT